MKKIIQLFVTLFPLLIEACSSEEFTESVNTRNEISVIEAVSLSFDMGEANSRTSITMGTNSIDLPVWAEGDTIGIYPSAGGDQLSFPIIDGIGKNTCIFTGGGWALKTSTATTTYTYTAYTPFNRNYYQLKDNTALPFNMLGQKQKGNNNSDHLGAYDLQIANGDTPTSGKISFVFNHKVAIVRMDITAPCEANWKSITLNSTANFTTEANMNLSLAVPTVTPTEQSNSVTLELENVSTTDSLHIVAYMMMLPVDFTDKTISMDLVDTEGNVYTAPVSINNPTNVANPLIFGAANARWISAEFFHRTINVTKAGTLSSHIVEENINLINSLKVSGTLNNTDIITIRKMTSLKKLNLENVEFTHLDNENSFYEYTVDSYYNDVENGIQVNSDGIYGINMFNTLISLESVVWSKYLSVMPSGTFSGCSNLKTIEFKGDLYTIGIDAFENCAFESFEIPATVKDMANPFRGCKSLTNLTIEEGNTYFSVDNGVIFNYDKSKLMFAQPGFTGKYIIPNSVSYISYGAFSGTAITSITFNNKMTYVPSGVCSGCKDLTEIIIPDKVTTIENSAFRGCIYNHRTTKTNQKYPSVNL